jgi:hypothetical protein
MKTYFELINHLAKHHYSVTISHNGNDMIVLIQHIYSGGKTVIDVPLNISEEAQSTMIMEMFFQSALRKKGQGTP